MRLLQVMAASGLGATLTCAVVAEAGPATPPMAYGPESGPSASREGGFGPSSAEAEERALGVLGGRSFAERANAEAVPSESLPIEPRVKKGRPRAATSWASKSNSTIAQAPQFAMREDGTSLVTVLLSRAVEPTQVKRRKGQSKTLEFLLRGVRVGVRNNTNPLVTEHFPTPLRRVVLRRKGDDAILAIELREAVAVTPRVKSGPGGTFILELVLPKPSKAYVATPHKGPSSTEGEGEAAPETGAASKSDGSAERRP